MTRFRAALAMATLALGAAAALFHVWHEPAWVLTTFEAHLPLAPIYGFLLPRATPWVVAALAAVVAAALLARFGAKLVTPAFLVAAWAAAAALALSVHAARSGGVPGRELAFYAGEEILEDAGTIRSIPEFLRTYTAHQPGLSLHGRTKPPGFALLEYGLLRALPQDERALGLALTLISACLPLPVYALARQLGAGAVRAGAASLVAATTPASVLFGAVSLDAVFAVVAAATLALAARLVRTQSPAAGLGLGAALFVALMLSYSAFLLGLAAAAWLALARRGAARALARDFGWVTVGLVPPFLVLRLALGFDAWLCFLNARQLNVTAMTAILGKPPASVWAYASVGNLLAFALSLGPAVLAALLLVRRRDLDARSRPFAVASGLALGAACFGGFYLMETERVLLYFVPASAVLAATSPEVPLDAVVGLSAIVALVASVAVFTLW